MGFFKILLYMLLQAEEIIFELVAVSVAKNEITQEAGPEDVL